MGRGRGWRAYVDAERDLERAAVALLGADHGPVLYRALRGGDGFREAVAFVARHRPEPFLAEHLDLVLRLAIEGGSEQAELRDVVRRLPPDRVVSGLPALAASVVDGGPDADRHLEYAGLMALLAEYGQVGLLAAVVRSARGSTDPDLREAAEEYLAAVVGVEPVALPAAHAPGDVTGGVPAGSPAAGAAWRAYVAARRRYVDERVRLMERPCPDEVRAALARDDQFEAAVRVLAHLLAYEHPPAGFGTVASLLDGLDAARRERAVRGLAAEVLGGWALPRTVDRLDALRRQPE